MPDSVEGLFNYLEVTPGVKPASYIVEPGSGETRRDARYVRHAMAVRNARALEAPASLDREGFALVVAASAVADFYDAEAVRSAYYPEVERLVRAATGASRVLVFDHNVRSSESAIRETRKVREPVRVVHNDYTPASGPQRVRDLLPDEAEALLAGRYAFINVWRAIRAPLQTMPLAVCDAQSVAADDWVATDLVYRDRVGEVYQARFNPAHAWYYYPDMAVDEALLIKCFDSATDGRARFAAHSAFQDPSAPADAPPRESIEARTIAFFADPLSAAA